jgi:3-hydroxyacyl-[acyl-carrier-protein] dehydratase
MNFQEIKEILPQDIPFLMIDRVLDLNPKKSITCLKCVSGNDFIFLGHFPGNSIFPGVLITEAIAQAAILMYGEKDELNEYLLTGSKMRFLKKVIPGDQMIIHAEIVKALDFGAMVKAKVEVDNQVVAQGELSFAINRINRK